MISLICYVVSTILTYVMGLISKKKNWDLPIPIQNIIIGIACFIGALIANIVFKQSMEVQDVLTQVIAALGGAGTATLYYDSSKKED